MPKIRGIPNALAFSQLLDPVGRMNFKKWRAPPVRVVRIQDQCVTILDSTPIHVFVENLKSEHVFKYNDGAGDAVIFFRIACVANGCDKSLLTALPAYVEDGRRTLGQANNRMPALNSAVCHVHERDPTGKRLQGGVAGPSELGFPKRKRPRPLDGGRSPLRGSRGWDQ